MPKIIKKISLKIIILMGMFFLYADISTASTYNIDTAHTQVIFKVKHMGISTVTGRFDTFEGSYTFDSDNIEKSSVEAKISAASVNTNKEKRDNHLRSDEFLDVEKYPELIFKSKSVKRRSSDEEFLITGDLTIHGVTKEVVFEAVYEGTVEKDPWGNTRTAFTAETNISRKDFGLTWNKVLEAGQLVVGDNVRIILEVEGIKVQ